ncbi:hypothetical protein [Tellurirhabdus rosea]|uniref:hypothetical protein n=1 Tax=Tellurirhabdus rosea TaxID=2674997 RepID=UPI0022583216|nr:hypothetical protein [Tellurirhabdus rosea]
MNAITRSNKHLFYLFFLALVLLQSCTTVRLISDYDEITDQAVTEMQEKVSRFFVQLNREVGTDKARHENYVPFYDDVRTDLNSLRIRANAIDRNEIVQKQISNLSDMIDNTEKLHKIGFRTVNELKPLQGNFDAAFTAIVKLQLALKRGEKPNSN